MNFDLNTTDWQSWVTLGIIVFVVTVLAFGFAYWRGKSSGKTKLRRLIGEQRQRLSVVRSSMKPGWVLIWWSLAIGGLISVAAAVVAYVYFPEWSNSVGWEGDFVRALLYTPLVTPFQNGSFIPLGCLIFVVLGIVLGTWIGARLGRKHACRSFDLTRALA